MDPKVDGNRSLPEGLPTASLGLWHRPPTDHVSSLPIQGESELRRGLQAVRTERIIRYFRVFKILTTMSQGVYLQGIFYLFTARAVYAHRSSGELRCKTLLPAPSPLERSILTARAVSTLNAKTNFASSSFLDFASFFLLGGFSLLAGLLYDHHHVFISITHHLIFHYICLIMMLDLIDYNEKQVCNPTHFFGPCLPLHYRLTEMLQRCLELTHLSPLHEFLNKMWQTLLAGKGSQLRDMVLQLRGKA